MLPANSSLSAQFSDVVMGYVGADAPTHRVEYLYHVRKYHFQIAFSRRLLTREYTKRIPKLSYPEEPSFYALIIADASLKNSVSSHAF